MGSSRLATVRVRTTLAAVVIVGLALVSASVGLVVATRHSVTENVRDSTTLFAQDIARQLDAGSAPGSLAVGDDEESLLQVIDTEGQVVRSSPVLAGRPPLADLDPGEHRDIGTPTDDDAFLAVAARTDDGRYTVLAARSSDVVSESTDTVVTLLLIGLPLLIAFVGATTWFMVGRTLRPVDAIRREVDEISTAQLHRRVPAPGSDDEIGRLAATMNRMLERLEQGQARLRRFVSDASHELRSPVTVIRQHSEVALAHPDRTTVGELAETVLAEDLRLQRLVDDLLLLARADEQTLNLHRRPVDLDDLVFAEAGRLRATTPLRIDTSAVSAGRIGGDAGSLRRMLRNLADNAARHASGTIAFSLIESDGHVVLDVDDDGPGVPETERQRVFERFVRLDEARARDDGGAGLGLSIVYHLVVAHAADITVADAPLGGARFEIRFPGLDA